MAMNLVFKIFLSKIHKHQKMGLHRCIIAVYAHICTLRIKNSEAPVPSEGDFWLKMAQILQHFRAKKKIF